ncbi:MAG: extracellular solute-binding protein [Acidimicrobiia bacterium]|nr:extracellular solute-binding protein [Acidimicrobiia bacterium]
MRANKWTTLVVVFGLLLAACGGDSTATTAGSTDEPTSTTAAAAPDTTDAPDTPEPSGDRVQIRWFVGLGAGSDADVIPAQEAVAEAFNASQDEIELVLEIVDNDQAFGVLNTQLAAGDAPDIVGPVGIRGRDGFPGAWLDLQPLVDANGVDLSDFDPELVKFYEVEGEGLLGLPFGVFPQFIFYNLDLFDEAGLNYPPSAYGEPYVWADGTEADWDIETVRELAKLLTVDASGNDATSGDFDPNAIVQFGFGNQWTDMRGLAALFGPGTLVDDDGKAMVPDSYREAMKWYQELAWVDNTYPFADYGASEVFGGTDNWFNSGNMAIDAVHLWYATCCIGDLQSPWNAAPMPSANGQTTAKLHADTFAITKATEHPEEAFTVLQYLIGDAANELLKIYGGMPARLSLQDTFFDELDEGQFAGQDINWDVVTASLGYNDNPNHEAGLPNSQEAQDCYNRITNKLFVDESFDVDAAFDQLVIDLQAIYDGTGACTLEQ